MLFAGLLLLFTVFEYVKAVRILCIYPVAYVSHQMVLRKVTEELVKQGHQLVVLTPLPHDKPIENVTEIDVYNITFPATDRAVENILTQHISNVDFKFWSDLVHEITLAQFNSPGMQALLHDETQHFDLILIEACLRTALLVRAKIKAPIAFVSSMTTSYENFKLLGAEVHPILFPDTGVNRKYWELSFFNKIPLLIEHAKMLLSCQHVRKNENDIAKIILGENAPPLSVLQKNVNMLLVNVHPIWDGNRPVPPAVVLMEGLNFVKPSPLPQDLDTYLQESLRGVIYMSLGSKHKSSHLPNGIVELILKVFASLPYDILWKWDGDELLDKPKNVRLEKWLPQNDLLHHPKVKAFITHSGLQSTDEAIAAEVPLIGLPIVGDQWRNSQQYLKFGIGVQLDLFQLSEEEFRKAIIDVAENKRYRENIGRLSHAMRERRGGGLSRAACALHRLVAGGARMLHSPLADVTLTDYYLLDIITVATCASVTLIALLVFTLRRLIHWLQVKNVTISKSLPMCQSELRRLR